MSIRNPFIFQRDSELLLRSKVAKSLAPQKLPHRFLCFGFTQCRPGLASSSLSLCGPGEGTVQGPYRPLRGSKVKNSKKRGSKKCWLGLMSCVDRGWLPGLCGWPLSWGPGQGDRACSPWCRLLRACHHPVPPFGRVSRLQAEDKLAFCFPWVYFNCIAATPDNGHILSPGNCPPPTGSCVPEKQDHHFQTWFFSSSFF